MLLYKLHESVRILQTLLKQTQISDMTTIKNQFYRKHQRLDDHVRKKNEVYTFHMECFFFFCLGNGRSLTSVFDQATVLGERYEMI